MRPDAGSARPNKPSDQILTSGISCSGRFVCTCSTSASDTTICNAGNLRGNWFNVERVPTNVGLAAHLSQAQALGAGAGANVAFKGFFHGHDLLIASTQKNLNAARPTVRAELV